MLGELAVAFGEPAVQVGVGDVLAGATPPRLPPHRRLPRPAGQLRRGADPAEPGRGAARRLPRSAVRPRLRADRGRCVSGLDHDDVLAHSDTVGTAVAATELRLDGPEAAAGVGQLLVRGPQLMSGYWRRPEATTETLDNGWLRTGDLTRIDDAGRIRSAPRPRSSAAGPSGSRSTSGAAVQVSNASIPPGSCALVQEEQTEAAGPPAISPP